MLKLMLDINYLKVRFSNEEVLELKAYMWQWSWRKIFIWLSSINWDKESANPTILMVVLGTSMLALSLSTMLEP